jgi:hypothetical protein
VRISLRFQWQGGAPRAGRASLDSRVRILSGHGKILCCRCPVSVTVAGKSIVARFNGGLLLLRQTDAFLLRR